MTTTHDILHTRGQEIVRSSPQLYIDLDVESDGIAGYGSLLSVGAVSPWGEVFYRELRPTSDQWLDGNREFCKAHNLERERLLDEGTDPCDAMRELYEWQYGLRAKYQKVGSVLVAFNASYDFPLIDLEFKRAELANPFGVAGYCIKSLTMALHPSYNWAMTAKSKLPPELLSDGDFTHNALEDAIYQQRLHYAMVGALHTGGERG